MKPECIIQPTTLECWCFFNILRPRCWLLCSQILGDLVSIPWNWFQNLAASEAKLITDWQRLILLEVIESTLCHAFSDDGGAQGKELYTTKLEVMKICFRKKGTLRFEVKNQRHVICTLRLLHLALPFGCCGRARLHSSEWRPAPKHCIFFFDSEPMSFWKSPLILCHCVTSIMFSKINCFLMISSCFALIESKAKFIRITTSIHNNSIQ